MISANEENSPERSEPRSGGATVAVVLRIGRVGRRLGRFFLFSGRGEDGRLVGGGLGGLVLAWTRKLWRGVVLRRSCWLPMGGRMLGGCRD